MPADRVIDVQYRDFVKDPWTTIKDIYQRLDRELRPEAEQRMRDFLAVHPGDGGRGRYTWSDTGLQEGEVRERVRAHCELRGADRKPALKRPVSAEQVAAAAGVPFPSSRREPDEARRHRLRRRHG